jgi:hypothetical protein
VANEARQLTPIDIKGGALKDGPDNGGGYMDNGVQGRKVPVGKGEGGPGQSGGIKPINGPLQRKGGDAGGVMK